ncbi:hypothetical protein ABT354_19370 [Streptomyces sp. NPDC000594]|uniref:acyltransferase n=1 Tax=Streptomyces sp. NPDC000594 TaxID=3154261 RepID=UPI00331A5F96
MTTDENFPRMVFRVGRRRIGEGVRIGAGTVIVADDLVLEDGASIGEGCDLRSARLRLGRGAEIGASVRVLVADRFTVGAGTRVDTGAGVVCRELAVGDGCYVGQRWRVGAGASMEERSRLTVGDRCQIAPDVVFNATEPITIGSDVGISADVAIWTHGYHAGHSVRDGHTAAFEGVVVEDGVWLGFRSVLLPGVRVGAGTVVAATATVTSSLPPGVLAAGVPAKVKRTLRPRALTAPERAEAVGTLLAGWLERLAYKGLAVDGGEGTWTVARGGRRWRVRHLPAGGGEVVVDPAAGIAAVFAFGEPLSVQGELDELGHDWRDFCRRATWLFPYAGNSTGIVPHRFARLLD